MVEKQRSVLIVDDEPVICDLLNEELGERGYDCAVALDGNTALAMLEAKDFNVVLLDIRMPGISGMELLRRVGLDYPGIAAIMVTGIYEIDIAVQAVKMGASDYMVKPFELDKLDASIRKALMTQEGLMKREDYTAASSHLHDEQTINVKSKAFREMNSIACGVETKLNLLLGQSSLVMERTVDIAGQLNISQKEIQKWIATRAKLESETTKAGGLSSRKVKRSPFAESIVDATRLLLREPELGESVN